MTTPNVEPLVTDLPTDRPSLPCPYPECVGLFSDADLAGELLVCGVCHRPAARCPRHGRHGRCRALNRPLARFCRHCRQELDEEWAAIADEHNQSSELIRTQTLDDRRKERVIVQLARAATRL